MKAFRGWLCLLLVPMLVACSTMREVRVADAMRSSPPPGVDYGKLVSVTPFEGRTVKFRVTEITDLGLGGNAGFFAYEDMRSLKVETGQDNRTDTAAVLLGILGVAALVVLIGNADSVNVCSSPPCGEPAP